MIHASDFGRPGLGAKGNALLACEPLDRYIWIVEEGRVRIRGA